MANSTHQLQIDASLSRRMEGIEIAALRDIDSAAAEVLGEAHPAFHKRYGSSTMFLAPSSNVLALNRIIGLGLWREADEETIDAILEDVRSYGVQRFFVQVNPFAQPKNLNELLESRGLTFRNNWVKLVRRAELLEEAECPFEVRAITKKHAEEFGRVCTSCFDWPEWMGKALAVSVGCTRWNFYGAFDGDSLVGTGAFYLDDDLAYISMAATLPEYRGKGAQQKLAARRINDAISQGCRWLTVETAEDTPERSAPSYRNMIRLGFTVAYRRPNYIWER